MEDLKLMKYAELRTLAKKAGIKANMKQEKLIAELTKHYAKHSLAKKTPQKLSTPFTKTTTPQSKVTTPVSKVAAKKKSATPIKPATPLSKVATPTIKLKAATPRAKVTPISKIAARKSTPVIQKALTPKSTSATKSKTATPVEKLQPTKRKHADTPSTPEPSAKKRRSTFEKAPTPDLAIPKVKSPSTPRNKMGKAPTPKLATPKMTSPKPKRASKGKRGSDKPTPKGDSGSPGVKDLLGAMKSDMTDEEMKNSLMSEIDKKVQKKAKDAPVPSSIPRFVAFVRNRQQAKPITPGNKNWEKIHEKNFNKFDSIDVYLEKKRKRAEEMSASAKKAKTMVAEVTKVVNKLKSHRTPTTPRGNENKKPKLSRNKNQTTPFKPSVLTTDKLDLNFGTMAAPKSLPHKPAKTVFGSTIKKPAANTEARKSTGINVSRKSTTTPFRFTAMPSASLNVTVSTKKTFDLKASLAKPLSWKPHKGKLKSVDLNSSAAKRPVSVAKAKARDDTRMTVAQRRANKKQDAQMARRGIKV